MDLDALALLWLMCAFHLFALFGGYTIPCAGTRFRVERTEILIAWPKAFCYDSAALESTGA